MSEMVTGVAVGIAFLLSAGMGYMIAGFLHDPFGISPGIGPVEDEIDWQAETGISYGNAPNVSPRRLMELRGHYCMVEYGTRRLIASSTDPILAIHMARKIAGDGFYQYPIPADLQLKPETSCRFDQP